MRVVQSVLLPCLGLMECQQLSASYEGANTGQAKILCSKLQSGKNIYRASETLCVCHYKLAATYAGQASHQQHMWCCSCRARWWQTSLVMRAWKQLRMPSNSWRVDCGWLGLVKPSSREWAMPRKENMMLQLAATRRWCRADCVTLVLVVLMMIHCFSCDHCDKTQV